MCRQARAAGRAESSGGRAIETASAVTGVRTQAQIARDGRFGVCRVTGRNSHAVNSTLQTSKLERYLSGFGSYQRAGSFFKRVIRFTPSSM